MSTISNDQPHPNGQDLAPRPPAPARRVPPDPGTPGDGPATANRDLAAAAIQARARHRSRARLGRRLPYALGHPRRPARAALAMLEAEADHIGPGRDPARPTHGETLIRQAGEAAANGALARSQRRLDKQAEKIEEHQARQAELITRARYRSTDCVRHPDGGLRPADEVARDEHAQRAQIEEDRADGSRKHQRLPRWIGRIPRVVLVADSCLLVYFFAGITDVDWASPLSADLAFAVVLTAMVTVLTYGFLAFAGHRLRSYKDHSGAIPLADVDGLTRSSGAAAIVAIGVLSALMFTRMRTEVLYALGPGSGATALLIAMTLAVVSALATFLVIAVHALDGSDEAARLEALSGAASRPIAQMRRMREEADVIPGRVALLRRRADRDAARAVTDADSHLSAATRIIHAARACHQAAGPHPSQDQSPAGNHGPAAAPAPDLGQLNNTLGHINAELPAASQPESL